jgi:beta-1,2-mannobiose phosphorylase / 1,2-beta-oligomannan phosphorylase
MVDTNKSVQSLGVAQVGVGTSIFFRQTSPRGAKLQVQVSRDYLNFEKSQTTGKILIKNGQSEKIANTSDYRVSKIADNNYCLAYKIKNIKHTPLCLATSKDGVIWEKITTITKIEEAGILVPEFTASGNHVLYFGEKRIKAAYSYDLVSWKILPNPVLRFQGGSEEDRIKIASVTIENGEISLVYFDYKVDAEGRESNHCLKLVTLDKENPTKVVWKSEKPLWESPESWRSKNVKVVGVVSTSGGLVSYWEIGNEGIYAIKHYPVAPAVKAKTGVFLPVLQKSHKNPILSPMGHNDWESQAVFNPAAIFEGGKIKLIYRAVGGNGVSVFGYAESTDGIHIDVRSDRPIFVPKQPFESNPQAPFTPSPQYMSGYGCGGCEDPRITKIEGKFYVTYTAWNGSDIPRVALTSIGEDDFNHKKWEWKNPVLISPPRSKNHDGLSKNWSIFPEKINGKYAVLHSLSPEILIDYFDSLDFDGKTFIESYSDNNFNFKTNHWNMRIRGAGPPPIKTKDGWLVLYRASTDDCGYTVGAMLLDGENPNKILYNSTNPILSPETWYEKEGIKPNIVYSCGAVAVDNHLYVYYGASDQYTCLATAPLDRFLNKLETTGTPCLEPAMAIAYS